MSNEPDRLDSWKEIADYLGRGVTTVRRWEREEGLPVRRLEHTKRGSIIAYRSELDAWRNSHTTPLPEAPAGEAASLTQWRWLRFALPITALLVAGLLGGAWTRSSIAWDAEDVTVRVLTSELGEESHATFAAGGERFAYASGGDVFVKQVGPESARRIFGDPERKVCCLRWSPDGQSIATSHQKPGGPWELSIVDPSGKTNRGLRAGGPEVGWRRDSKAVLFTQAETPGGPSAVFEFDLASGRTRQVSFPPAGSWGDIAGAQSPDGRLLAVARYPAFGKGDVYVAAYGEKQDPARRLTSLETWVVGVDWTPDGQSVVFGGQNGHKIGIHGVSAAGGSEPALVSGTEGVNRYPEVVSLRDGSTRIGFTNEHWNTDLIRLDPAQGLPKPVATSTRGEETPDVSGDGRIVFASNRAGTFDLWVCEGDCRQPRQITFLKLPFYFMTPRWSPDGRRIAYCARAGGKSALLVSDANGRNSRILSQTFDEGNPAWSADGRFVYCQSNRSGKREIWRIPADGSGPGLPITSGGGSQAFESSDGRWLYYTRGPDHAPLVRRSLPGGNETNLEGAGRLNDFFWRVAGASIFRWEKESGGLPQCLWRFDPETGRSTIVTTEKKERVVNSFSVNAAGVVVWSSRVGKEADILAVDLHPRRWWQPEAGWWNR